MCESKQTNLWIFLFVLLSVSVFPLLSTTSQLLLSPDSVKRGFLSIALQLSPLFWVAFALRIKCLTAFLEGQLCRQFFASKSEDDDHEDDHFDEDLDYDIDDQSCFPFIWSTGKKLVSFGLFFSSQDLNDFLFCLFQNPYTFLAFYSGSFSA